MSLNVSGEPEEAQEDYSGRKRTSVADTADPLGSRLETAFCCSAAYDIGSDNWRIFMGLFTKVAAKIPPVVKQGAKDAQQGKENYKVDAFAQKGRDARNAKKK